MLLIDYSPIAIAGASMADLNDFNEDFIRHMTLNSILSYRKHFSRFGETYIVYDGQYYWRKDYFKNYKGQRKAAKEASSFPWKEFNLFQDNIKRELEEVFPYHFLHHPKLEADDIIGYLALNAKEPTCIISPDGDFFQCLRNPHVSLYSNIKKKFAPNQTLVEIEYDLHKKIMKGDKGDNIRNVLSGLDDVTRQPPVTEKLIEYTFSKGLSQDIYGRYEQNKKLIDLREIPDEYKLIIDEMVKKPIQGSKGKVFNYLTQKKLNRVGKFLQDINSFC